VPGFHSGKEFSALAGEGTELVHDMPVLLRIPHYVRRGIGPLLPQATGGKVWGCSLGPKDPIEVKQCAESKGPVVAQLGLRQVAIKVSADQIGVRAGAEGGKSDAVGPAVGASAGQQEFADAAAELGPAGYSNQPGGSPTLSPTPFKKDAEFSGSDLPGSLDQVPHEQLALRPAQPQEASTQTKVPSAGRDESSDHVYELGVGVGIAHGSIFARRGSSCQRFTQSPE
jgi:hypothetical protein